VFCWVSGKTACAAWLLGGGEVGVETAVKSWRKKVRFFYIFKAFFAQLLSGRLPAMEAFRFVTF
jgi:hypothetical protein